MTLRQIFEGALIELSKVHAPSLLLQDFNYFLQKAINNYINKRYNIYDVNQQTSDDLRVLKSTTILTPKKAYDNTRQSSTTLGQKYVGLANLQGATYEVNLPNDYLHLLNCICVYRVNKNFKCYDEGSYVQFAAKRLTADSWSTIINDFYNRPLPERPYFYIHNINRQTEEPTNQYDISTRKGTDQIADTSNVWKSELLGEIYTGSSISLKASKDSVLYQALLAKNIAGITDLETASQQNLHVTNNQLHFYVGSTTYSIWFNPVNNTVSVNAAGDSTNGLIPVYVTNNTSSSEFPRDLSLKLAEGNRQVSLVEKPANLRHSNASQVRCEIRYGKDSTIFELVEVIVDYIKSPQHVRLTQEQVDLTEDTSQIMEFPDYVCQEIINELVHIVMEYNGDSRLQTHPVVSQSIASPTQQQTATN